MNKEDRDELKEMLELVVKPIDKLLQEHHSTLFGDGSDSRQGLRVDVDRLKQDQKIRYFFYVSLLGLALKDFWEWVTSIGKPN